MPRMLLAVDGSAISLRAARRCVALIKTWNDAQIALLNVEPEPRMYGQVGLYMSKDKAEQWAREAGDRALVDTQAMLDAQGIHYSRHVWLGVGAEMITRAAANLECDLIAMGTRGAGALANVAFGSTAQRVAQLANLPVLVVPPGPGTVESLGPLADQTVKVLAAVDGSSGAQRALDRLAGVLPWFKRAPEIHLLAVADQVPASVTVAGMVDADAIRAHQEASARSTLAGARAHLPAGAAVVEHTAIGDAAVQIHRVAAAHHCDMIVMGTRGLGALGSLLLGSTTTKVLHLAEAPVLVVP